MTILLESAQVHYLTTVLRLNDGATVYAFDSNGTEYETKLVSSGKRSFALEIIGTSQYQGADAKREVHIGQGMTEKQRLDWAVEKMTETGVCSITPLISFGTKRIDHCSDTMTARWFRIATAACTQCGRVRVPIVSSPLKVEQWLEQLPGGTAKFMLSIDTDELFSAHAARLPLDQPVAMIIGRASGFDSHEAIAAKKLGFVPVSLGERILRTETVGVVAMSVLLTTGNEL